MEIKYKQYVFVPKKPNMTKGKIASQVAHATFMALEQQDTTLTRGGKHIIELWKKSGMCVIVLEAKDTEHLNNIAKYLEQSKVPHHLYIDEGITEVDPMTPTALATGVLTEDKHWIFEQFELFGEQDDAQSIINEIKPSVSMEKSFVWMQCKPKCTWCRDKGQISTCGIGCPKCGAINVGGSISRILG